MQDNAPKGEKRITLITANTAINMNQGQKLDIKTRRKKNWKRLERMRGIRMKRKLKFFTYGFYIGAVLWGCGLVASMIVENVTMKILLILIPLAIYQFFTIGKGIIEDKIKRGRY